MDHKIDICLAKKQDNFLKSWYHFVFPLAFQLLHFFQHLFLSVSFILVISVGLAHWGCNLHSSAWWLIMLSTLSYACFTCVDLLLWSSLSFKNRVICLFIVELQESICILGFTSFVMSYEYLLTVCSFLFFPLIFLWAEDFIFDEVQFFSLFSLCDLCFLSLL